MICQSDPESSTEQLIELLGCDKNQIVQISAKQGIGIDGIFDAIVNFVPHPRESEMDESRALIFDSNFDQFRGVVPYVRVFDGYLEKGMTAQYFAKPGNHEIVEVGILKLNKVPVKRLEAGQVGYVVTNLKDVSEISVGDTMTSKEKKANEPLSGYQPIKPMVFSGLYPIDSKDYEDLRVSLEKLKLNDAALTFEPNTSTALGFGFRCGFLGPLHMEIVQERLEREFNMNLITSPNVSYKIDMKMVVKLWLRIHRICLYLEIWIPFGNLYPCRNYNSSEYIGAIMNLCISRRGTYESTNYLTQSKVQLHF